MILDSAAWKMLLAVKAKQNNVNTSLQLLCALVKGAEGCVGLRGGLLVQIPAAVYETVTVDSD